MIAKNPSTWRAPSRNSCIVCFAVALFVLSVVSGTRAELAKSDQNLLSQTASSEIIPLPEVATRAAEVVNTLTVMQTNLISSSHLRDVQEALSHASEQIRQQLPRTAGILQGQPSLATLQAQQKLWQGMKTQTSEWLKIVTARSVELRKTLDQLADSGLCDIVFSQFLPEGGGIQVRSFLEQMVLYNRWLTNPNGNFSMSVGYGEKSPASTHLSIVACNY